MNSDPTIFEGRLARSPFFYRQWMLLGNPAYFFENLSQRFGDFVYYRGIINFYLVNHPALVKQLLQETHSTFDKNSRIYNRFRYVFGNGLVVAEGDRWKKHRKLLQPMFGPLTVKRYFDTMRSSVEAMLDRWAVMSAGNDVFDCASEMNRITLEIAGRALFRQGFEGAADRIEDWTDVINRYCAKPPLPIIRSFWFPSRRNFELKRVLGEFNSFIQRLIDQRRDPSCEEDLLSILLAARDEETGRPMSDAEIAEEVLGMIIGGHETASSALTWLWYELAQNPTAEARLHHEIDTVVGDQTLSLSHLPELRFTKMILDETMRLHPPFWFENRNVMEDTQLGGVTIPKGSMIVFSRYSLHRHPSFWKSPDCFNPDRFAPEHEENKRSTHAYVPFGGGPRICIGINFAMLELLVIVASIAQRYRVLIDPGDRHAMSAKLTMRPKHGLRVRLQARSLHRSS